MINILIEPASVRKDYAEEGYVQGRRGIALTGPLDPFRNGKCLKHSLAADQKQTENEQLLKLKTASSSYFLLPHK